MKHSVRKSTKLHSFLISLNKTRLLALGSFEEREKN